MADCPHYEIHIAKLQSQTIGSNDVHVVRVPYCTHQRSPAPKRIVTNAIGGANILQCGGDLQRCQVPKPV